MGGSFLRYEDPWEPASEDQADAAARLFADIDDVAMPPICEFVERPEFLGRQRLYPRQRLILKLVFLEVEDLTPYELETVGEWIEGMRRQEGHTEGVNPDVFDRIAELRARGQDHFREVVWIGGRRGSKNHVGALVVARLVHRLRKMQSPQLAYGIDMNKSLRCLVSATNWEQAKTNQYQDIRNVLVNAACFRGSVVDAQSGRLFVRTPFDEAWGARSRRSSDSGSIVVEAVPSNAPAARGVAAFMEIFDEEAHAQPGTAGPRTAEEVYDALTPALDQTKRVDRWGRVVDEAMVYTPTSPWQRSGPAWNSYRDGLAVDPLTGAPSNPDMLVLQLSSFQPHLGWDDPRACGGRQFLFSSAPELYDDVARRQERRNPAKFRVERLAQWADVESAYLEDQAIRGVFLPFPDGEGGEVVPLMQDRGILARRYRAHLDAASSQNNYAAMIAHAQPVRDAQGQVWAHVVVDWFTVFRPRDFPEGFIDYVEVERRLVEVFARFKTLQSVTFDQFSSAAVRSLLKADLPAAGLDARVYQVSFNARNNLARYEALKDALGMSWVHAPRDDLWGDGEGSLLERELRYLQMVKGKVCSPDSESDDLADCLSELTEQLLREQLAGLDVRARLSEARVIPGLPGGYPPRAEPPPMPGRGAGASPPTTARQRLEGYTAARAQRTGMPPGWTRGISRWGRRWQ